jgi:hypothetical protein
MNKLYALSFLILTLSCSPGKNNKTAVDSTQNKVTDSVAVQVEETTTSIPMDESSQYSSADETAEPPTEVSKIQAVNFPDYSPKIFTDDKRDSTFTTAVMALLNQYDSRKYMTIQRNYSVTYQVGNDYDDSTVEGKTTKSSTWYFDENGQLTAYAEVSQSEAYNHIDDQDTSIYLFENEKLKTVYRDHLSVGQMFFIEHERIVVAQCPTCGVRITEDGGTPQVSNLDQSEVSYLSDTFFKEYNIVLNDLKVDASLFSQKDSRYHYKLQKPWDDTVYTLHYSVDANLLKKFAKETG